MTTPPYVYRVDAVERVVDGDTFDLVLDVGFHLSTTARVRLLGYDTPELHDGSEDERAAGARARTYAAVWWRRPERRYWVRTAKDPDGFGRWLGDVWSEDDVGNVDRLGVLLVSAGLATVWPTRWREQYDR